MKFLLEAKIGRPMCSSGFVVCYYYRTPLVLTERGSHYCLVVYLASCTRTLPIACNQEGYKVVANPGKVGRSFKQLSAFYNTSHHVHVLGIQDVQKSTWVQDFMVVVQIFLVD